MKGHFGYLSCGLGPVIGKPGGWYAHDHKVVMLLQILNLSYYSYLNVFDHKEGGERLDKFRTNRYCAKVWDKYFLSD